MEELVAHVLCPTSAKRSRCRQNHPCYLELTCPSIPATPTCTPPPHPPPPWPPVTPSVADGKEVRSVGNSQVLKDTALVEAFNLKAAIEYSLKQPDKAKQDLASMPPR